MNDGLLFVIALLVPLCGADLSVMQAAPEARPFDDRRARLAQYAVQFEAALNALPQERIVGRNDNYRGD